MNRDSKERQEERDSNKIEPRLSKEWQEALDWVLKKYWVALKKLGK